MPKRDKPLKSQLARQSKKDREFMETARARFKQGQEADENQRERELDDLRFAAGDQWPADIALIRRGNDGSNGQPKAPARPMLTVNQTIEPLNQLLAQMSNADLGFELVSADDFSDLIGEIDETEIKTREGLARRIQRDSQAIEARLWGADRGNICGRGYWAVLTRYVEGQTFDQEVYVHKIYNQNSVTLDPNREHFDGSDAQWGFIGHDMPWDEYVAEFGDVDGKKNPIADASDSEFRALGEDFPTWFTSDEKTKTRACRVVDYYYVEREPRQLVMLADQSVMWADDAPDDAVVIDDRWVIERKVKWAKIDGYQILEETDFPAPYIPIVEYICRPLQPYDGERRAEGVVRPMTDSGRGFNYMLSRWVEAIGLSPLRSIMMAEGQDENYEQEWQSINTRTGIAHYKQTDLMGRPAPPPSVPPTGNDVVGPISGAIQVFKDSIHATTQSHGPSQGEADPALRSAKAIAAVVANDQRGDSTIISNWARSIRQEGRIINSLLYPIYGIRPGRLASIIDPDGQQQTIMLNRPFQTVGQGKTARPVPSDAPNAQRFKLTKDANFNVVVKVTKNYETLRQEQAETLGQIIASDPGPMMSVFGDLFFKMQDGPGHDEMAERMKAVLNPKVLQQMAAKSQGANIPPEVLAQVQNLQSQLQEAQQIISKAQDVIKTDQVKHEADLQKTKMTVDKDILIHQMDNAAKIEVARISASKSAGAASPAMSEEELLATGLEVDAEARLSAQEHAQDKDLATHQAMLDARAAAQEHAQTMQEGEQQAAHAMEQGRQQVAGQMATAEQQAALQPPQEEA